MGFSALWLLLFWSMGSVVSRLQYLRRMSLVTLRQVGSSWTRHRTSVPALQGRVYPWTAREAFCLFCFNSFNKVWLTYSRLHTSKEYSLIRFDITVWKDKKIGHWKTNSPGQYVPNMLLEISGEITPEIMKRWTQSKHNTQLWMWLVIEAKFNVVKSNIA